VVKALGAEWHTGCFVCIVSCTAALYGRRMLIRHRNVRGRLTMGDTSSGATVRIRCVSSARRGG
jgi:hypothetical protein